MEAACDKLTKNLSDNVEDMDILTSILKSLLDLDERDSSLKQSVFTGGYFTTMFLKLVTKTIYLFEDIVFVVVVLPLVCISLHYIYKKAIKPYNYIQDLDLPGTKEKRKDMINVMRRLRKIGKKLPPAFANGWYSLIESSDVKPGEVKQVDCIGENFAVFRTLDGKVHVSDAYCPHLGANMAVGGVAKKDCIECPFHKWQFDAVTGKCTNIPNVETVPKGVEIKIWTCTEVNGAIHVWYDAESRTPQWEVPSEEKIDNGDWCYHGRNEFLISSHMQDIPENGADLAHLNAIHVDHLAAGKILPLPTSWNIFGVHQWDGIWMPGDVPHEATVTLKHKLVILDKILSIDFLVIAKQIGPSYVQLRIKHWIGEVVFLQSVTPLEPLLQKVVHRLYAPWYIRPFANVMMWGETVMFHRDVMVWNSKEFVYNPILAKTDKCLKAFRKWFQQFYSESSTSFKDAFMGPQRDILDW